MNKAQDFALGNYRSLDVKKVITVQKYWSQAVVRRPIGCIGGSRSLLSGLKLRDEPFAIVGLEIQLRDFRQTRTASVTSHKSSKPGLVLTTGLNVHLFYRVQVQ
jgi:hypothetical protein